MAATPSQMIELGSKMPVFELMEPANNRLRATSDLTGSKATVVMFICNHCPFVIHIRPKLLELARQYENSGIGWIAINSNSVETHPQDGPDEMIQLVSETDMPFPFLFDADQSVAKSFRAACTPDFFIYKSDLLVYRGQFDDSRPGNGKRVTGKDLQRALDQVLADETIPAEQTPSIGCNIKWKPGQEPNYSSLRPQ